MSTVAEHMKRTALKAARTLLAVGLAFQGTNKTSQFIPLKDIPWSWEELLGSSNPEAFAWIRILGYFPKFRSDPL